MNIFFIPFYHLKKANGRVTLARPSLQPRTPANSGGSGCQRLDHQESMFLAGCPLPPASSSAAGRHPFQASATSQKKPVANSEVLGRRPHLVAKPGKAIASKDDWQVATPRLPELPGTTTVVVSWRRTQRNIHY